MEQIGLKINIGNTKFIVTGNDAREVIQSGRWPCGCCGRGVGVNSVLGVINGVTNGAQAGEI